MYVVIFFWPIRTLKNANQIDSKIFAFFKYKYHKFSEYRRRFVSKYLFKIDEVSFLSYFRLMWYLGKDVLAEEEATQGIIERLETDEGITFKKIEELEFD
jgi:hypothetical protein